MESLDILLGSLITFIGNEANLFFESKRKMKLFRIQLQLIQENIQPSESMAEVIHEIRSLAYEAEDLIREHTTRVERDRKKSLGEKLRLALDSYTKGRRVSRIIDEIKEIRGIPEKAAHDPQGVFSVPDLNFHVDEVVDFVKDMDTLVTRLIEDDQVFFVIPIVGMGGSGKTALAKKLFNDERVKNHFEYGFCLNYEQGVSFTDNLRKVVGKLAKEGLNDSLWQNKKNGEGVSFTDNLHKMFGELAKEGLNDSLLHDDELKEKLKKILLEEFKTSKYLIVLDNIWETKTWDELKKFFPNSSNGSRIVITSRNRKIGHYTNSSIHFVPELAESDSTKLFCKKAFGDDPCPNNLETVVKKVVGTCHGLPLTLLVLGRLLAKKEREKQPWPTFIGNPNSYPDEGRRYWRTKLATSYDQLEPMKKLCFFYLGVFPANYGISVRQLIQLWISEELIPQHNETSLENIAEEWLDDLIDRCLVQRTSMRLGGGAKTCRVHYVFRDLCVWESKKDDFLEVRMDTTSTFESKPRRLSVHYSLSDFKSVTSKFSDSSALRSFICFAQESYCLDDNHWDWLCQSVRVVRVLNLENVQVDSIPKSIGELILLKYLKLKGENLKVLPESIGELWNLVTLDLRGSPLNYRLSKEIHLPKEIWKLENLRHLYLSRPTKLLEPPYCSTGMPRRLPCLQAISKLVLDQESALLITEERFPRVTKLGLYIKNKSTKKRKSRQEKNLHDVYQNVCRLSYLKRLTIEVPLSEHLGLQISLRLLKLEKVTLVKSKISSEDVHVLGALLELRILKIIEGNLHGGDLRCDSFATLEVLKMTRFPIQNWTLREGAMPRLKDLIIEECQELKGFPTMEQLTNLKNVHVRGQCSHSLTGTLKEMKNKMKECLFQIQM